MKLTNNYSIQMENLILKIYKNLILTVKAMENLTSPQPKMNSLICFKKLIHLKRFNTLTKETECLN